MTCHNCQSICRKFGKHRNGLQRFRCSQCRKTFTEDHATPLDTMRLPMDKAKAILKLMVEGMSIRSIERITGVHRDTILRLLLLAGERCTKLMHHQFTTVEVQRIQCDELHCFVAKRERSTTIEESDEVGEQYTFVAMDADTKLVFSWLTGKRSPVNTYTFMRDVHSRMGAGPPLHRHDLGCPMLREVRSMGTTDDGINRLFLSSLQDLVPFFPDLSRTCVRG